MFCRRRCIELWRWKICFPAHFPHLFTLNLDISSHWIRFSLFTRIFLLSTKLLVTFDDAINRFLLNIWVALDKLLNYLFRANFYRWCRERKRKRDCMTSKKVSRVLNDVVWAIRQRPCDDDKNFVNIAIKVKMKSPLIGTITLCCKQRQ